MKTSVASKSMPLWLKTRASSIVSAVPLPSSLTPGARLSSGAFGSAGAAVRASGSRGAAPPALAAPWPPGRRDRVVVPADVDPPRAPAGQNRHHVAQLDVARDAALRHHLVGVEADLQLRAVALHLVEDPLRAPRRCRASSTSVDDSVLRVSKLSSFFRMTPSRSSETVATSFTMRGSRSAVLRRRGPAEAGHAQRHTSSTTVRAASHPASRASHVASSFHLEMLEIVARFDPLRAAERRVVEVRPRVRDAAVLERDRHFDARVQARVGLARDG